MDSSSDLHVHFIILSALVKLTRLRNNVLEALQRFNATQLASFKYFSHFIVHLSVFIAMGYGMIMESNQKRMQQENVLSKWLAFRCGLLYGQYCFSISLLDFWILPYTSMHPRLVYTVRALNYYKRFEYRVHQAKCPIRSAASR